MKTFKGKPITLLGEEKKVGDIAPNFVVIDNDLNEVSSKDFKTDYVVINVVPSLDTAVCDLQTRTINIELNAFNNLEVLTISNDLPFAQKRWCGNVGMENMKTYSDYLKLDFGKKYGVYIEELGLLARSIFVLNQKRQIIYVEYKDEMSQHLDYDSFLDFIKKLPKV